VNSTNPANTRPVTMRLFLPVVIVAVLPFGLRAAANLAAPAAAASPLAPADFAVDPVHSTAVFRVRHTVSPFWGSFHGITGKIAWNAEAPEASVVEIEVDAASVSTGNAKRDEHLRSPDFFSVKEFPEIAFKSTKVEKKEGKSLEMTGDLTFHGKTRSVTAEVDVTGEGATQQGYKAGFEATFEIKRSDFGVTTSLPDLGDEVRLIIALQAKRE
jgi:polyisoprenoid-binding protein YceI